MKGYPSAPAHQCGHCTFPLCKNRRVEETCPHWTAKEEACA